MVSYIFSNDNIYMKLNLKDYTYILRYYNKTIPFTQKQTIHKRETKKKALRILKQKLYSCKRKLQKQKVHKNKSIAVCTRSVINNKGFSPVKCNKTQKQEICLRKNRKYTQKYKKAKK